jgi:hypothetical protein
MSYPTIQAALPSFSSAPCRGPRRPQPPHPPRPPLQPSLQPSGPLARPSQLLDWLRLAARNLFGPLEISGTPAHIERIEPYRACNLCVSRIRWCGDGTSGGAGTWKPPASLARLARLARAPRVPRSTPPAPRAPLASLAQMAPNLAGQGPAGISPLTSSLVLGATADPYPPAESVQRKTRRLLEWVARVPYSLEISILTRSPLLLRDLDLLVELDQRHAVTVSVLIPAADPKLAGRLDRGDRGNRRVRGDLGDRRDSGDRGGLGDPGNPGDPRASRSAPCDPRHQDHSFPASVPDRFDLIHTLAAHGIATQVLCTPIVPGLNNGAAPLRRLFELARRSGASDVVPAPRHPALPPTRAESQHLLALFRRLRLEQGFPRALGGRG